MCVGDCVCGVREWYGVELVCVLGAVVRMKSV